MSRIPSSMEGHNGHKPHTMQTGNSQHSKDEIVIVMMLISHYRNPNQYFKTQYPLCHSLWIYQLESWKEKFKLKCWLTLPCCWFCLYHLRYNCLKVTRCYFYILLPKLFPPSIRTSHGSEKKSLTFIILSFGLLRLAEKLPGRSLGGVECV